MARRGSVTQVTDPREHVRACTGRAIEENHRKWFSSQTLSKAFVGKTVGWSCVARHGLGAGNWHKLYRPCLPPAASLDWIIGGKCAWPRLPQARRARSAPNAPKSAG